MPQLSEKNALSAIYTLRIFNIIELGSPKKLGVHALTRNIIAIRSVFKYAYETDLIDKPMKFGIGFSIPSAARKRKAKSKTELKYRKKLFTREELLTILKFCDPDIKAAVLLGINGGFGNSANQGTLWGNY